MTAVVTYFNPLPAMSVEAEHELIVLWQKSWRRCEFEPIVLTHLYAEAHPRFQQLHDVVIKYPSINPPGYDYACWARWAAVAQYCRASGSSVLAVDYDVIATAFSPDMLALPNDITVLDRGGVPCAVYVTPDGAEQIVDDIINVPLIYDGRHGSDMLLFQQLGYPKVPELTAPYGSENWQNFPAFHASHSDCGRSAPGKKRADLIRLALAA